MINTEIFEQEYARKIELISRFISIIYHVLINVILFIFELIKLKNAWKNWFWTNNLDVEPNMWINDGFLRKVCSHGNTSFDSFLNKNIDFFWNN